MENVLPQKISGQPRVEMKCLGLPLTISEKFDLLRQANDVLTIFNNENIVASTKRDDGIDLNKIRQLTSLVANSSHVMVPAMTSCVATTLLKVGLCQELAQRFVLEYCINYQKQDVSHIFLSNPNDPEHENHVIVLLGPVNVPDTLLLGKNAGINGCIISPETVNQDFTEFLENNKQGVIADPLLKCAGALDDGLTELTPLFDYCREHNITKVHGVRPFHNMPGLVEYAPKVKSNAVEMAQKVAGMISDALDYASSNKKIARKTDPLSQDEISALLKKYSLPDDKQESLEKGLRNAANNNKIDDLKLFLRVVKDINAKDDKPTVGRTALHWAAAKKHQVCCQLLLEAGANPNLRDANGVPASSLMFAMVGLSDCYTPMSGENRAK